LVGGAAHEPLSDERGRGELRLPDGHKLCFAARDDILPAPALRKIFAVPV
jgi:hypothetical protein